MWNGLTVTAAVVSGSSAVTALLANLEDGWHWLPGILAGGVAILGAIDPTAGTARRANQHTDLARQFIGLEQRFSHGRNLDDDEHEELTKSRLQIEASEPPVLRLLDAQCHFEVRSLGDQKPLRVPLWRRITAHWVSHTNSALTLGEAG